jgi:hypothetical protein
MVTVLNNRRGIEAAGVKSIYYEFAKTPASEQRKPSVTRREVQ